MNPVYPKLYLLDKLFRPLNSRLGCQDRGGFTIWMLALQLGLAYTANVWSNTIKGPPPPL